MKNKYHQLIRELSDSELLKHLYLTQLILIIISITLSFFFFESFVEVFKLFSWNPTEIGIGLLAGLVVVLVDIALMNVLPSRYYDDGGLNERIFANRTVLQIAIISALVAFSEELLFRGMVQTHQGLIFSSILFSLIHYRYLFNWFLFLNITLLSFFIGVTYEITDNLLVTIVMHFVIDFCLGILIKSKKNMSE